MINSRGFNIGSKAWIQFAGVGLFIAGLIGSFWSSYTDIIYIWWRSATFAHGFLVLPIVVYLIWRKRHLLQTVTLESDWRALPVLGGVGLVWLLARLTEVAVIEQLMAVAFIPLVVWLTLGSAATKILAFPLGFLFFAVPMGEGLVEPLMQFTAAFTVMLLRFTGLPVFWDGTFFSIPSGDWSVVAACSGIRYLIASLFLGVLYAYLNYHSLWRRLAFIALSAIVPVFANGVRAYLIVMIGHLSGMKLAVGVDHLIYGWVFFGFIMFLLFALGNLWSEPAIAHPAAQDTLPPLPSSKAPLPITHTLATFTLGLCVVALWPVLNHYVAHSNYQRDSQLSFVMPTVTPWQISPAPFTTWTPRYLDAVMEMRQEYQAGDDVNQSVGIYLAFYDNTNDGELVNSENQMVTQTDSVWKMPAQYSVTVTIAGAEVNLYESRIHSETQMLLVWHGYWIDGHWVANGYLAKLTEAWAALFGHRHRQVGVVFYAPMTDDKLDVAQAQLQQFVNDAWQPLHEQLQQLP
ncbi:exosortase A [Chromatium okenii]|uniref:exosortase A n=1 Tax=Chromatium okenii TaxID=61644 RepID=UPI0019067E57|nr:exosortase A [Chromatium okenii]MBK1640338.1 exosortase A [Chromatium okenii]